jgi:hypothetical protein
MVAEAAAKLSVLVGGNGKRAGKFSGE